MLFNQVSDSYFVKFQKENHNNPVKKKLETADKIT